jgi:hypothetical protein
MLYITKKIYPQSSQKNIIIFHKKRGFLMEGKLYKRENGYYYMVYKDGSGKIHRKSTKKKLKKQARKVLENVEKKVSKGYVKGTPESLTFQHLVDDYWSYWKDTGKKSTKPTE